MNIYARIDKRNLTDINRTIARVVNETSKGTSQMIKQASIWALQSASKATPPGAGLNVKRLAQRFRFRPIERIPESEGYWYAWAKKGAKGVDGRFFRSTKKLSSGVKSGRLIKIKYGIKYWSKRRNRWSYVPYWNGSSSRPRKYDKNVKRGRIPSAAAAKYGWLRSLGQLSKKSVSKGNVWHADQAANLLLRKYSMVATNRVSYVRKVAPHSASIALTKTAKRLRGFWLPKLAERARKAAKR